jgi:hypothetical protein
MEKDGGMDLTKHKKWATPLTIGAFIVSGVSGMLMFLKINFGLLRVAHEWISVLLVIGGIFHIVGNFNPFKKYFTSKAALTCISVIVLVGVLAFAVPGDSHHGQPSFTDYSVTLQNIPLTVAAEISKTDCESVASHLSSHGIKVADTNQTINEIAKSNNKTTDNVLAIVFENSLKN